MAMKDGITTDEMRKQKRYHYRDCLIGVFEHPRGRSESWTFDLMFVVSMATAMIILVNMVIRPIESGNPIGVGADIVGMAKMFPLLCIVAFCARLIYADRASLALYRRFVIPRFDGFFGACLLVGINVVLMAPLMCATAVLIGGAPLEAIPTAFATILPFAAFGGFLLSLILIRPLVMLAFSNVYVPHHRA